MSTYPVLMFGTGVSGGVILVLAVFNTPRHASTDNRNRINRKCFHFSYIVTYLSVACFRKGVYPETLHMFYVVLLEFAFFLIVCVWSFTKRSFCLTVHLVGNSDQDLTVDSSPYAASFFFFFLFFFL